MSPVDLTRRDALAAGLASLAALSLPGLDAAALERSGLELGPAEPFGFDRLKERAAALAKEPFHSLQSPHADILEEIDYNSFFRIVFRKDRSLWHGEEDGAPMQFFHLGRYCKEPCRIAVLGDGEAREIRYRQDYFDMPADHVARQLPEDIGFAGFRAMAPDQTWDWMSFLGASYFRSPGSGRQYGLSARGLAIDTALPSGEEFPRFTHFWLESVHADVPTVRVLALLESQSATGAYSFLCRHGEAVTMDVEAAICPRTPIERLGIAPLTSMYWYGEAERWAAIDWRPEIHDSDGLAIWTGAGERIWRPISNPPSVMTNSFVDENPKGFGLLQRDRAFANYQDDGVFYHRRPSLWVEPLGQWGRGSVQLVEIPTDDETFDNIVAYWVPEAPVAPGGEITLSYRLHWADAEPFPAETGRVVQTLVGIGGNPGERPRPKDEMRIVVDFRGGELGRFGPADRVEAIASASRGRLTRNDCYPVAGERGLFRAVLDLKASGAEPVDLRLYLSRAGKALTETWLWQVFPDDSRRPGDAA